MVEKCQEVPSELKFELNENVLVAQSIYYFVSYPIDCKTSQEG